MEVCSHIPPLDVLESTPNGETCGGAGVAVGVVLGRVRAMGLCPRRLSDDGVGVL